MRNQIEGTALQNARFARAMEIARMDALCETDEQLALWCEVVWGNNEPLANQIAESWETMTNDRKRDVLAAHFGNATFGLTGS